MNDPTCKHADGDRCADNRRAPRTDVGCEVCAFYVPRDAFVTVRVIRPPAESGYDGSEQWAEMHRLALAGDDEAFDAFVRGLNLPACCAPHWAAYLAEHPPGGSRWEWSVAAHNAVSARIGRPMWTLEQARAKWQPALASDPRT